MNDDKLRAAASSIAGSSSAWNRMQAAVMKLLIDHRL